MKYLFFTYDGYGLPIAYHLIKEGKNVLVGQILDQDDVLTSEERKTYPKEETFWKKRRTRLYKHIIPRISADALLKKMRLIHNPQEYFVFFDHNNLFHYAEQVRDLGFHGNFPTREDRLFELDRNYAKEFVKKHYTQLKVAETHEFQTIDAAKKFLAGSSTLWVIKGNHREAPTFVPEYTDVHYSHQQIIDVMEKFKIHYERCGFILERKISSLIEITPEKIYYDGTLINFALNIENKNIGCSNLSFQTDCAADLIIPLRLENKIHDIAFPPIVDKLAQQHKGLFFWDASLLIDKTTGEIFFGEFCPNRPWYNSFYTYLAQVPSVSFFFENVIAKKNPFTLGKVGVSTTLFNLDRDAQEHLVSDVATNFSLQDFNTIWPFDIYSNAIDGDYLLSGWDDYVAPVTGAGMTIREAVETLYDNLANYFFPNIYYRPKFDFLSLDYPTSILNRLQYGLDQGLYQLPFPKMF